MSTKKGKYGSPEKRKKLVGDLALIVEQKLYGDPRMLGGSIALAGGSREQGTSLIDIKNAVILNSVDVCTMDTVRQGVLGEQVIFASFEGRINKTNDHVKVGFMFGPDGAAALITQLLSLADRHGAELLNDITRRLTELHQDKDVDLYFLKAAIDLVLEETSG